MITVFATNFGAKKAGKKGAFLGFMLTMGGIVMYWIGDYIYIQRTVTHLCETEGGIKVYVTPEEWRKQVGEEEWKTLYHYNRSQQHNNKKHYKKFDGAKYTSSWQYNDRILKYSYYYDIQKFIGGLKFRIIDTKTNQLLLEGANFSAGGGSFASTGNYKEWINNIQSCRDTDLGLYQLLKKYSNNLTGENK